MTKILMLEDISSEAELTEFALRKAGINFESKIIETELELIRELQDWSPDLILSDYSMPQFTGMEALEISKRMSPGLPFIILTGSMNEETAVECMKAGADDYVLKEHRVRLGSAVRGALLKAATKRQLQESQEVFRLITENVTDLIAVLDLEGRRLYNSPSYGPLFGDPESILHTNSFNEIHPEDRERIRGVFFETVSTGIGQRTIYRLALPDGSIRHIESQGSVVRGAGGKVEKVIVVSRDITERVKAEEKLRASEERYRDLFKHDLTADALLTPDGVIQTCNPAFVKGFGFETLDAALQSNFDMLFSSKEKWIDFLHNIRKEKKITGYEFEMQKQQGEVIFVVANAVGTFDARGDLLEIKVYIFDETERKNLQQQLIQAQKMESIGTLAGGIAHDFNNILGIILGYTSLLERGKMEPEQVQASLQAVSQAVKRGANLVRQILTFARKGDVSLEPVQVNVIVEEMCKMLEQTFPRTIVVASRLEKSLPIISIDPAQLHQALLNLCVNSRDAILEQESRRSSGGTITIETRLVSGDVLRKRKPEVTEAEYLSVSVSDDGMGMNEETKKKIFEPFYTTKDIGKGTGLGLSVVYGVVKGHHGLIEVESEFGKGTTFALYFPVLPLGINLGSTFESATTEIEGGTETILLVEDEVTLADLMKMVLEKKGYKVIVARDGIEAVQTYTSRKNEIDLVITDMGLPKLDGAAVFATLRTINPRLKVILASGYLEPRMKSDLLQSGAVDFVQKPYQPAEVLQKIRQALVGGNA